jgi:PDZ domain
MRIYCSLAVLASSIVFASLGTSCCAADDAAKSAVRQVASVDRAALSDAVSEATLRLNSPRFGEREAASKELIATGAPAVSPLRDVALEGSLEAAVRAVGILESIYVSAGEFEEAATEEFWSEFNDDVRAYIWVDLREAQVTADAAEFALDELERVGRPAVAERAEVVLESHYDIRERRAVSEIERLRGKAIFGGTPAMVFWNARGNGAPLPNELQRELAKGRGELTMVIIGRKWTGGDEGLKQVARLKKLRNLYRIEGTQVTDNGVRRLQAALPGLEIVVRAAAKLGIEHRPDVVGPPVEQGCTIESVKPGEAAANAGLRSRDVILRFAGQSVTNFDSLIEILHHYNPGDTVEATISRNEEVITVLLTLTGWD